MTMMRELCGYKDAQYDRNLRISHMFKETFFFFFTQPKYFVYEKRKS